VLVTEPLDLLPYLAGLATEDLDRVIAELDPAPVHDLVRAHALGVRFDRDHDPVTLGAAVELYRSCSFQGPQRGLVGRALVVRQLRAGLLGQAYEEDRIRALIDDAGDDPEVAGASAYLHAITDALAAYADDPRYDRTEAATRLAELAGTVPPDSEYGRLVPTLRMVLAVRRGHDDHYSDTGTAAEYARAMLTRDLDPTQRLHAEALLAGAEGMAAADDGELDRAAAALLTMTELVDRMPASEPATVAMHNLLAEAAGTAGEDDASHVGLSASERAWRLYLSAVAVLRPALNHRDVAELDRGVHMLHEAAEVAPADYPHRAMILSMLGRVLCAQYQLGGDRPALDEALHWLSDAQEATAHPGHPLWASTATALGFALRLDDRRAEGRAWGQRALRGHAWNLLLHGGTADAVATARHAVDDATQVARWCLADGDAAGAATALETGRCLLTYAATTTTDIADRLRALDRPDLLTRWRHDNEEPELRAEVLAALTGVALAEPALPQDLDPPSLAEIGQALTSLGADAVVYLLPGDEQGTGVALVVPVDGPPVDLTLPRLAVADVVHQHIRHLGTAPADDLPSASAIGLSGGSGRPDGRRGGLDRLCDWAWSAGIGPLLAELSRSPLGHAPRLVLIPIGGLAAVPWHAARDRTGGRAVEQATFSYASSARLLCRTAESDPAPAGAGVLIVADPAGDLPGALALRTDVYPGAEVLDERTASAQAVRDWLLTGGGVLHLACPAVAQAGPDGTYLRLPGGERLTTRDILRTRDRASIGLVALTACTTTVPSDAYDEAFSLPTALRTAGARSVFGSLWASPDDATSLLLFMAHHYLRRAGERPVDALNRAQRWMLDGERLVPPTMPPALVARLPLLDPDDVASWAGVTHQGR
jgi:CHAT domain-containing protein